MSPEWAAFAWGMAVGSLGMLFAVYAFVVWSWNRHFRGMEERGELGTPIERPIGPPKCANPECPHCDNR